MQWLREQSGEPKAAVAVMVGENATKCESISRMAVVGAVVPGKGRMAARWWRMRHLEHGSGVEHLQAHGGGQMDAAAETPSRKRKEEAR